MNTLINFDKMSREVYCFGCKTYSITNEVFPKCKQCKRNLIKVIKSVITGQKLTKHLGEK